MTTRRSQAGERDGPGSSAASEALAAVDALRGVGGRFLYLTRTLAEESESARLVRELGATALSHVIHRATSGTAEARVEDRQRDRRAGGAVRQAATLRAMVAVEAGNSRWRRCPA